MSLNQETEMSSEELETDPVVLARREKQLEYGKNSVAYDKYSAKFEKHERRRGMPRTPNKHGKYSRRQWDGLVRAWKIGLHKWDAANDEEKTSQESSRSEESKSDEEENEESDEYACQKKRKRTWKQ